MIIDRHHHIVRFSGGEAGRYLEPSAGAANLELLNNLRKSLRPIVRTALQNAFSTQTAASRILAVISAVITQTLKTSATPGAFAADIEGRIAAVARAHSRLTDDGRGAASLEELVVTELAPFNRAIANVTIEGLW